MSGYYKNFDGNFHTPDPVEYDAPEIIRCDNCGERKPDAMFPVDSRTCTDCVKGLEADE